jgi:hypothetical protein
VAVPPVAIGGSLFDCVSLFVMDDEIAFSQLMEAELAIKDR